MPEDHVDMKLVGDRLRSVRLASGRKIADVATEAGVSMPYLANLERGRGNPTFEVLTRIAKAAGVDLATLLGTETPVEGIDLALATLPRSLRDFSLTDEFKARTKILAEDQGRPPDEMRAAILAGMAAAPQRSSGEATITDWRRLFDAFARNLT